AARERADPLFGTAAPARRWLLIEEPGSWGAEGLLTSTIENEVAQKLAMRAKAAAVRPQLIRRAGRRDSRAGRRFSFVDADLGCSWWGEAEADADLLDVPLHSADQTGSPTREPIYLVCTHGRKDVCCAIWGRPVAQRLASRYGEETWETSHVGGDRFAANLVVLPHGLYYGHLAPEEALAAAKAYQTGQLLPYALRGRSTLTPPEQAAECLVREALNETRLDALRVRDVTRLDEHWQVRLSLDAVTVTAVVRGVLSPSPARLTCSNPHAVRFRSFELVNLSFEGKAEPTAGPSRP
ncbi:MAG: sucrase ferredoxin, partial [Micromonosporaceae bacterium]